MNSFFVSTGRAAANVVDGTIDLTAKACLETGRAGTSLVAGWRSQRRLNAMVRQGVEVIKLLPSSRA